MEMDMFLKFSIFGDYYSSNTALFKSEIVVLFNIRIKANVQESHLMM